MYVLNCRKWLVWPLLGLALSVWPIACDYISIIEKFGAEAVASCNEKCPFQNRTGDGHFDLSCGTNCTNQQCTLGCSLWNDGLENSCQTSCNVTSESVLSRELYCVIGCNEALNTYFQKLRELIGIPPPPALVADTISPTSLSLVWEAPSVENLRCVVQWRYEELPATWHYYSGLRADSHIIHLHTLKPYTKYRFRIAIFLSGRTGPSAGEPIFSAPSVVISTLESGPPSSPPASVRATAPDPTRIAVSWQSGQFANGPLIGYVLRLSDVEPNVYSALKDMPASNNTLFYMFQNLSPSRHYEISVSMRNAVGEGPRSYVRVDTPAMPTSIRQQPILILGGEQSVLAAPANDMLSDPVELYTSDYNITGIGIDVTSDYLFVSVSAGYIYRTSLSKKSKSIPIITPDMAPYTPLDLSVDWLNRHLYILGEVYHNKSQLGANLRNWEILRCDFDGRNQLVALGGFNSRPMHFEVDPYNGYLFWVLRGVDKGGLYRLDLANISNGVRHDAPPEWIVKDAHLGPFTVDHAAFRILVAHLRKNNILAVSLDGAEVSDFRSNTQTPQFSSARWLAYAQGLFYWSAGARLLAEEYHAATDSYFHNEYPLEYPRNKHTTTQVLVNLRSCQPLPVPVNPPRGVAAVLGPVGARVCWEAPSRLPPQGLGAPPQWRYRLQATPTTHTAYIYRENINGTSIVINGLDPDTEYVIKVAAVSESGTGPWSSEFVGRTLDTSPATSNSTLVWSTHDGLMETDLTGDRLRVLLHSSELNQTQITSISWYLDKFYLVTNESTVLWLNTTTGRSGVLSTLDQVACVAIDWLGKRLYWSNPKQQLISRGTLDGTNREPVPIVTVALEMLIDAPEARLYWNTGHAVEAGSLQGEHRMVYYPAQLFSGRQVMGITIDLENRWLYWLVRSYDGSELHRAPTAERLTEDAKQLGETLVNRVSFETGGPLTYIHGKMVWGSSGAISDPRAKHHAILREGTALAGKDPTVQANAESLIAIPEMVDASSIKVIGNWSRFGVTWTPDTRVNVNRSQLLYDVTMQCGNIVIERTVSGPPCWSPTLVPAHSRVLVSIRAHGPWGGAPSVSVRATTPPAPPRPPTHPRLYLHTLGEGIVATFRWEPPSQSNGVILGYETKCWVVPDPNKTVSSHLTANSQAAGNKAVVSSRSSACADASLPPSSRQLVLRDRKPSGIYYFQVRAFTEAGYGPYSEITSASSHDPTPIPKVIISSQDAIRILDLDSGDGETIPKSTGIPVDFDVSFEENVVYWVNNLEEIFSSRINGSGHYKILSINGSASSMCTEWISGSLYWSQAEGSSHVTYTAPVTAHGTATARLKPVRLFQTENSPHSMRVVPLKRTLYWYEETSHFGFGTLMTSKTDGGDVKPFFNQSIENRDECNCPDNPQIAKTFTIDMTSNIYEIYWVDPWQHQIIATDLQSCKCRVVVDATEKKKYGFTPMSIAVDSKYVYWFNSTERIIYYANKNKKSKIEYVKSSYGYKILAFDSLNQPYPPLTCLYPESERLIPEIIDTKAYSISLHLPTIEKVKQCSNFEFDMPLTEYTVFYKEKGEDIVCDKMVCQYIVSVDQEVTINDLKPFTNYSVTVEATNYYAKLHLIKPIVGEVIVLQTAAEAPTPATDVSATVLSPFIARVEWTPAPGLWYEVHWQTDHATGSLQHKFKEHNTFEVSEGRAANMTRLSPDTSYSVWVRARSNYSSERVDSDVVRVKTYPLPPDVVLDNATAFELRVLWNPPVEYRIYRYKVEYTEISVTPPVWLVAKPEANSKWIASELQPATRYKFRLTLQYLRQAPTTHWPHDERFTFETLATVPSEPGVAIAEALGGRAVRARWAPAQPRGAAVDLYRVWGRPAESNSSNSTGNATEVSRNIPDDVDDELRERILREGVELLYNGTENYWVIGSWELGGSWEVWVQAHNAAGWGGSGPPGRLAPPAPSAPPAPPAPPAPTTSAPALSAALAAALLLTIAVTAHAASVYKNRNKKKTSLVEHPLTLPTTRPDVELAILRQLPIGHFNNVIYNQGLPYPTDAELASLPHIRREQITLNKFLGSGAFGEVFEGVARGLADSTADTKVAVKTLRKGATDQEKAEFLQEAALMSNFKHSHILRLLGVCLDNDPHYIIMELMEGGDLLSYLRTKRSSLYTPESLTLLDLLNMCVDVTKGCRYLEEMHFVHRDLAARNCLVAHRPGGRIVKIGDFGLARDIYKNDYYRKEGEGLLPVRWMAVECLVDGVFSCQSDVWAWGVTCWEILSLGNQPYPLATNRQVLALVRAGGAPTHPPNCPTQLYDLLKRCWNYRPEARPTFKECLQVVTELRDKTSPNITLTGTAAHHAYLTVLPSDAVENRTYLLDENGNTFIDEDIPEDQQSLEQSRTLPQPTPKYLELMYGPESISSGAPSDGYEIPRLPLNRAFLPQSRHSIVGIAPNRLIKPPLYRTHSLRTNPKPTATITPLRNGLPKRASLCEDTGLTFEASEASSSRTEHNNKTQF